MLNPVRDLPNLSVHQLLYVREAARAPSWSEAARRLGVTQPALSQGVAEVERRLDVKLFDRRARRRSPTPELAEVLKVAEQILARVDDLDHRLEELRSGRRGTVRIGMIDTAALGPLAPAISAFRTRHPDITLTIVVEPSVSLSERVASGELDLAVVVAPNAVTTTLGTQLSVTPLFAEGIYVYPAVETMPDRVTDTIVGTVTGTRVGTAKTRSRRKPAEWGPWVTYPAGSQSRELIAAALARLGVPMEVVAESSNPDVLRQMVRLGVGWCALPHDVAEAGDQPLKRIPGRPLAVRNIAAIRRTDGLPNASTSLFFAAVVDKSNEKHPAEPDGGKPHAVPR